MVSRVSISQGQETGPYPDGYYDASLDGLEATRILKADATTSNIPILALTSYAMKGDEERALEAGCDGYITKPIDIKELLKKVADYLSG